MPLVGDPRKPKPSPTRQDGHSELRKRAVALKPLCSNARSIEHRHPRLMRYRPSAAISHEHTSDDVLIGGQQSRTANAVPDGPELPGQSKYNAKAAVPVILRHRVDHLSTIQLFHARRPSYRRHRFIIAKVAFCVPPRLAPRGAFFGVIPAALGDSAASSTCALRIDPRRPLTAPLRASPVASPLTGRGASASRRSTDSRARSGTRRKKYVIRRRRCLSTTRVQHGAGEGCSSAGFASASSANQLAIGAGVWGSRTCSSA